MRHDEEADRNMGGAEMIIEKSITGSTNDDAKELARQGAEHATIVWAHTQTKGRGSHAREWHSFDGNLHWSIILRPNSSWHMFTNIIYVKSIAVYRTVKPYVDDKALLSLKWPNDVLLNGKKLSGTLTEASGTYSSKNPDWIVTGTGINVVAHPDDNSAIYKATNLHEEGYQTATKGPMVRELLAHVEEGVSEWIDRGFSPVRDKYLELAHGLGKTLRVGTTSDRSQYTDGKFLDISNDGAIVLELDDGSKKEIHSGEVIRFEE